MMCARVHRHFFIVAIVLAGLALGGCEGDDSETGDGSSGGSGSSASSGGIAGHGHGDAVKYLRDELDKRWLKSANGWISEYPSKTFIATGERAGPESFYREIKELS